ncbi:MAG: DUF4062 domain-containing protein [Thermotogota bacterium]
MNADRHRIGVFLASPGDVEEERHAFRDLLHELSGRTDYEFTPVGFEDLLASTGPRPQDSINALLDQCDVFLCVFHRRWGQTCADSVGYTAYTEEEFQRALRRFKQTGAPRIMCFFKQVGLSGLADPGEQLAKVLAFRRSLEESRQVTYRVFSSVREFQSQLEAHLLAIARGEEPALPEAARNIHVPIPDQEPEREMSGELALADQAASAARNGHGEEAAALFARLSQTSRNIQVLDAARAFFVAFGNADAAQSLLERKLTLIHDRRLAAREYVSAFMSTRWVDDLAAGIQDEAMAESLRRQLSGERFQEALIQYLAEYFTVGELVTLGRFYSGEGASISAKFGRYMAALPEFLAEMEGDGERGK